MGPDFWFTSWTSLGRIAIYMVVGYVSLITLVRLYGKRSISKRNPSDFVITVAIGSVFAPFIMRAPISLVDGVFALTLFLRLQHLTEWATTGSKRVRKIVEGSPTLPVYDGKPIEQNMK